MRYVVTNRHIGKIVEHRDEHSTGKGTLIRFEKRGRFNIALVQFETRRWWVDRGDLYPVSEEEA